MTCSRCSKRTDGQIVAVVYVARDDDVATLPNDDMRFTGVVWCAECVLAVPDAHQIRADMDVVAKR